MIVSVSVVSHAFSSHAVFSYCKFIASFGLWQSIKFFELWIIWHFWWLMIFIFFKLWRLPLPTSLHSCPPYSSMQTPNRDKYVTIISCQSMLLVREIYFYLVYTLPDRYKKPLRSGYLDLTRIRSMTKLVTNIYFRSNEYSNSNGINPFQSHPSKKQQNKQTKTSPQKYIFFFNEGKNLFKNIGMQRNGWIKLKYHKVAQQTSCVPFACSPQTCMVFLQFPSTF